MKTPAWFDRIGDALRLTPDRAGFVRLAFAMAAVLLLLALHPGRDHRWFRHALTWGAILLLFILQWRGAAQIDRSTGAAGVDGRLFLGLFLIVAVAALFVPPFQSSDVYAYVNSGWLQVEYGLDPYVVRPADVMGHEDDPMLSGVWSQITCVYGFVFAHVARGIVWLGGGHIALTVLLFKAWSVVLLLLTGVVVLRVAQRGGVVRPERAVFWILLNLSVVLHGVSHAHNDVMVGLLVVLACAAAIGGRWILVPALLLLGVLVKVTPIVALPFALVFLVRRHGWGRAGLAFLIGAVVAGVASLPYVLDVGEFRFDVITQELSRPSYSLAASFTATYAALARALPFLEPSVESVTHGTQLLLVAAYVVFVASRVARACKAPKYDAPAMTHDVVLALAVLLLVASAKFSPWFLLMIVPPAMLLPDGHPLQRLVIWLSIAWLLVFTGLGKARIVDALVMTGLPLVLFWRSWRRDDSGRWVFRPPSWLP